MSNVQVVTCPFSPASCTPCLPPPRGIPVSCGKLPGTGQGLDGDPGAGGESLGLEETLGLEEGPWAWRRDPGPGGETLDLEDNFMAAVIICSDFGVPQNKVCHYFHCFPIYLP